MAPNRQPSSGNSMADLADWQREQPSEEEQAELDAMDEYYSDLEYEERGERE